MHVQLSKFDGESSQTIFFPELLATEPSSCRCLSLARCFSLNVSRTKLVVALPPSFFRSAAANLSIHPAPSLPLRTLTLGVLIVSGGTLASLPFRRYQAIPDASSGPVQATGPTQSELGDSNVEKLELLVSDTIQPLAADPVQAAESDVGECGRYPSGVIKLCWFSKPHAGACIHQQM